VIASHGSMRADRFAQVPALERAIFLNCGVITEHGNNGMVTETTAVALHGNAITERPVKQIAPRQGRRIVLKALISSSIFD
jgi:hypothetical protein